MAARTYTDIINLCENRLGWAVDYSTGVPAYKQRNAEIAKIKAVQKRMPEATIENLELAVEYSWRYKLPVDAPVVLCYRIEDALEWLSTPEPVKPLEQRRLDALRLTVGSGMSDEVEWIRKLQRSYGDGVEFVLQEWEEARRVGTPSKPT